MLKLPKDNKTTKNSREKITFKAKPGRLIMSQKEEKRKLEKMKSRKRGEMTP